MKKILSLYLLGKFQDIVEYPNIAYELEQIWTVQLRVITLKDMDIWVCYQTRTSFPLTLMFWTSYILCNKLNRYETIKLGIMIKSYLNFMTIQNIVLLVDNQYWFIIAQP